MIIKPLLLTCAIAYSASALAAEDNIDKIVSLLASKLITAFVDTFKAKADKPKVFIGPIQNSVKGLGADDVKEIVNGFETAISNSVIVVDRESTEIINAEKSLQQSGEVADGDIQALGDKYGASKIIFLDFSDKITPRDENLERVKINVKLTVVDVKTQRKDINKLIAVDFEHRFFKQSYYVRDALAWTFWTASAAALGVAITLDTTASDQLSKYNKATTADDAVKWREKAQQTRREEQIAGSACVVAAGIGYLFYPTKRDDTLYHKYELSILPFDGGVGMGVVWNH